VSTPPASPPKPELTPASRKRRCCGSSGGSAPAGSCMCFPPPA